MTKDDKNSDRGFAISVRVSESTRAKIEQFRDKMGRDLPGSRPSLTDAVRVLIERGLAK